MALPNGQSLTFERPLVMGIVNVTPDSFSDGGMFYAPDDAIKHARQLIADGADIIDVGGESTRPGSEPVPIDDETRRVIPVIRAIREHSPIPISIDTTKSDVAEEAIKNGATIINDISALRFDHKMVEVASAYKTPVVLMHMLGQPKTMQEAPHYHDCLSEIRQFFSERIHFCLNYGIDKNRIIIDPGIGFGKRLEDNLEILRRLEEFRMFDCPLLLGASRKSFISMITRDRHDPLSRIGGSIASAVLAVRNGAHIVRVHDVAATVEAIKVTAAIEGAQ
ncbi:MAG: dihydropteroate synthase [candidate division Zixibacteria bacterium]|nr:dihydropteroate synthase [candidate division Zixibacteria bacterium]